MNYMDFHCDTLGMFGKGPDQGNLYENSGAVDLKRMKEAGCLAQFFATFLPPAEWRVKKGGPAKDEVFRDNLYQGLMGAIWEHSHMVGFARSFRDYEENKKAGKISAFLTFEDGRMLEGSQENLERFYALGYRLITFTWNFDNCLGSAALAGDMSTHSAEKVPAREYGLTDFGKETVEHMEELGMIVDVSHGSDALFYDVADVAKKPFIASHSNARALTPSARNLSDEMLRVLGERGGVTGLNFCPGFLGRDLEHEESTVARICDHMEHILDVAGSEALVLGSDWDGFSGELEVTEPRALELIFRELGRRGVSHSQIERIAFGNGERILRELL